MSQQASVCCLLWTYLPWGQKQGNRHTHPWLPFKYVRRWYNMGEHTDSIRAADKNARQHIDNTKNNHLKFTRHFLLLLHINKHTENVTLTNPFALSPDTKLIVHIHHSRLSRSMNHSCSFTLFEISIHSTITIASSKPVRFSVHSHFWHILFPFETPFSSIHRALGT